MALFDSNHLAQVIVLCQIEKKIVLLFRFRSVLFFILWRAISHKPPAACIRKGDLTKGHSFCVTTEGGYNWRGLFSEFYGILKKENNTKKEEKTDVFKYIASQISQKIETK